MDRKRIEERRDELRKIGKKDGGNSVDDGDLWKIIVGDEDDEKEERRKLMNVRKGIIIEKIRWWDEDKRNGLIDERNRKMIKIKWRIELGVDIGDLIEIKRELNGEREGSEEKEI